MPNPIVCRTIVRKLLDHAADRLPADEREHLEGHLTICASCRRQAQAYRRLVALMAEAGQAQLPPSRADWQMLAARMEATGKTPCSIAARPGFRGHPALAGAAMLALLGIVLGSTAHVGRTKQPGPVLTVRSTPAPQKQFAAVPAPLRRHHARPNIQMAQHSQMEEDKRPFWSAIPDHRPSTPDTRHPRLPVRQAEQVRRLLAQAARQIDALERVPQDDTPAFLVTFEGQGTIHLERNSASVQVTVMTPNQSVMDSHTAFQPNGMAGGTLVRQTSREQPDGDRTTETIATIFSPDRPDGFLNLQTCSTPRRRLEGEPEP